MHQFFFGAPAPMLHIEQSGASYLLCRIDLVRRYPERVRPRGGQNGLVRQFIPLGTFASEQAAEREARRLLGFAADTDDAADDDFDGIPDDPKHEVINVSLQT